MKYTFPSNFNWGVATSSFQIEGATEIDGRGPSIWDRMCSEEGRIADATDGKIACDHYHRYEEDVQLMSNLKQYLRFDSYFYSIINRVAQKTFIRSQINNSILRWTYYNIN